MSTGIESGVKSVPHLERSWQFRRFIYPLLLGTVFISWFSYMSLTRSWSLFNDFWPMSMTMALGSFVAGATPQGGAAVAFPVFTKVLTIPSGDARTFGLMIQSVGMTMAAILIVARRVPVLWPVIGWSSLGGLLGMVLGTFLMVIPAPYPKVLFTCVATSFGIALFLSRWVFNWKPQIDLADWNNRYRLLFASAGLAGGMFAANTGSGIDMLIFIVLTLAFGIDEKISTPTSVIVMGLNSVVGFLLHGLVVQDIGIVWSYWLVAVPVAATVAPFGAYMASRVPREYIIIFLLSLIGIELVTTIWLVPFDTTALAIVFVSVLSCALCFTIMLRYRFLNLRRQEALPES